MKRKAARQAQSTRGAEKQSGSTERFWSAEVARKSNALELEAGVFALNDPREIARSLKRSAEASTRRNRRPVAPRVSRPSGQAR